MSLSHYEQSRLCRIEASLCRSDPKLAGMLGMFGRLCAGARVTCKTTAFAGIFGPPTGRPTQPDAAPRPLGNDRQHWRHQHSRTSRSVRH